MNTAPHTSESERLASLMQALASPVRLRILGMLAHKSLCVKVIAADLAVSQPAVSQHLRVLRQAGLVAAHRSGYYVHYRLDRRALRDCQACLAKLIDEPEPDSAASGICLQRHRLHTESNP
jgi:DNA-binding transcriptional ArsR family regulator